MLWPGSTRRPLCPQGGRLTAARALAEMDAAQCESVAKLSRRVTNLMELARRQPPAHSCCGLDPLDGHCALRGADSLPRARWLRWTPPSVSQLPSLAEGLRTLWSSRVVSPQPTHAVAWIHSTATVPSGGQTHCRARVG